MGESGLCNIGSWNGIIRVQCYFIEGWLAGNIKCLKSLKCLAQVRRPCGKMSAALSLASRDMSFMEIRLNLIAHLVTDTKFFCFRFSFKFSCWLLWLIIYILPDASRPRLILVTKCLFGGLATSGSYELWTNGFSGPWIDFLFKMLLGQGRSWHTEYLFRSLWVTSESHEQ